MFILKGHLLRLGDCPGCIYPQGQRLRHLRSQWLRPLGAAWPHALRLRERARRRPCCTGPGATGGRKRDVSTRGEERFFAKKKRSWGCGRVFEKKQFLFVSIQIQMLFVKFPDVFFVVDVGEFQYHRSSGKPESYFRPGCGCCGFHMENVGNVGKVPQKLVPPWCIYI